MQKKHHFFLVLGVPTFGEGGGSTWLGQNPKFFQKVDLKASLIRQTNVSNILQVCLQFHPAELDHMEPSSPGGDRPLPLHACLPRHHLPEPGGRAYHPDHREQRVDRRQPWKWGRCALEHFHQLHLFSVHQQGGNFLVSSI